MDANNTASEIVEEVKIHIINLLCMIHTQIGICESMKREDEKRRLERLFELVSQAFDQFNAETKKG